MRLKYEGTPRQPLGVAIAHVRAKVDGFEPRTQHVNLRIVRQSTRGAHNVHDGLIPASLLLLYYSQA